MAKHVFTTPVALTGAGAACALGVGLRASLAAIESRKTGLRPLAESGLEVPKGLENLPSGWVPDRSIFKGRRYGAAGNAAVVVAREAVSSSGWTAEETRQAWLYVGTSRGNVGERAGTWKSRRPVRKFAASNTMHSEVAAAVSLQLGLQGPWQVLSNGCAAGLDAAGHAALAVAMGWTPRALVVAVDLPLVVPLLEDFCSSGVLATTPVNDPYAPSTSGFFPAEGIAAITLESGSCREAWCGIRSYAANSDAHDAVALPPYGRPLGSLAANLAASVEPGALVGLSPHATGTAAHRVSEAAALDRAFPDPGNRPSLLLFKPYTGHALGASGLLDMAILAGFLRQQLLPPNLPGLTPPSSDWKLPIEASPALPGQEILKIASGMGGHNTAILLGAVAATRA